MKTTLTLTLLCLSLNVFADQSLDCHLKGVSDNDLIAPKMISLDQAREWSVRMDKKKVSLFELKESQTLVLTYTKNKTEYRYNIDNSQCEDGGVGSASLLMTSHGFRTTAVYICECAVD
jgi:hypothetical protein